MKRLFLTTLLAALALTAGQAQTTPAPGTMTEHRLAELTTKLGLTDSQKEQLKPILQETSEKVAAIRSDAGLDEAAKKAQIAALRESEKAKFAAVLTPEQQATLAQARK